MSTTNGNMKTLKVTDRQGNVYILMPVDTEARQTIEEAKNLNFDDDFFTAEETDDEVNIGLNGVPMGVEEDTPLRFAQDNDEGLVLTSDALFANQVASIYVSAKTYNSGDYVIYNGKIYKCTTNNTTGDWDATKWQPVIFLDYSDAPNFSSSSTYAVGAYVKYNDKLWVCKTGVATAGAWNDNNWTEVYRVIPEITSAFNNFVLKSGLAANYSVLITYKVGDYCFYNDQLYRCIVDSPVGGGNWVSNNWQAVTYIVSDIINNITERFAKKVDLAAEYNSLATYEVGDICYHEGSLYQCNTAISGEQWNANHWDAKNINQAMAPKNHASQNTTYGIGTEDTLEGGTTVYGNYGHVRISNETLNEYSTHENGYAVGKGHKHSQYALQSNLAEEYSAAGTYEVGDICYHEGSLYQCSSAITVGEQWDISHWGLLPIKLVDKLIKKSVTTGLVKNDGTIDATNYLADTDMYSGMGDNTDGPMTQKAVYDYLGSHWFINDTSGARWYELLTVNNPDASNTGAGELFAVGIKDADGNYSQALLSITSYGPNNELVAKLITLNSFVSSYSTKVQLLILRNYSSNYTLYAKLGGNATINNAIKIKPIMCTGTISIGNSYEVSEPSGSVAIDNVTNLFTTTNGGIGNQLQPVYVHEQGLVAPCNTANMVVALTDVGGPLDTGDTSSGVIVEDNILVTKTSVDHPGNSINIQRLVLNKVYKILFLTGTAADSQRMKLISFYENSVHNMEIYTSNSTVYNTPTYEMIATGSIHGASYTSHIMRTAQNTVYIIDGY